MTRIRGIVPSLLLGVLLASIVVTPATAVGGHDRAAEVTPRAELTSEWSPSVQRVYGANRYETAVKASQLVRRDPCCQLWVYVASGDDYPDALSAAQAVQSPHQRLLLVSKNRVPSAVQTELERLRPSHIYIVGGTGVISKAVEDWMWTLPSRPFVERIAGANRYETSLAVVRAVWGEPAPGGVSESTIVTGRNYPDSLAASAATTTVWRGSQGPLILVDGRASSTPTAVRKLLDKYSTIETRVVGGSGAVSDAIMRQLPNPVRLGGADRYETAVALNTYVFGAHDVAYLATGEGFADALAGSGVAASTKASLYLVEPNCVPTSALAAMAAQRVTSVRLLGGPSVLGTGVAELTPCT